MKKKNSIFLILSIVFVLPALFGLLHFGFFPTDDGNWMVIRFSAFFEALRNGQFPVRFLPRLNNGFGYPVADFLYPLFMYIGVPIHILGFSFVNTIKIILGLSLIFGSLFSFLWLRKMFDGLSSFVGSVVYTFFPYHLWDVYKRGSVGEVLSLSILPFVLWQMERRSLVWTSLGIAFLILAHNTLAIIFLFLVVSYMVLDIYIAPNRKKLFHSYISMLLLGFGMSSFFWIPAIFDLQHTVFFKTQVSNWGDYFSDFNLIGFSTIFVILFTVVFIANKKIEIKKHRLTVLLFAVGLLSIFLSSSISTFLWNFLPVSFIQFPFRLLSLAIPSIAFLAACIVSVLSGKKKIIMAGLILIVTLFSAKPYLLPDSYQDYPDSFYSTNQDTTTVKNEYMPKWVKNIPQERKEVFQVLTGDLKIQNILDKHTKVSFETISTEKSLIQFNTVYFPGWNVKVDAVKVSIVYQKNGLITYHVPSGKHRVFLSFGETPLRIFADLISAIAFLSFLLWLSPLKNYIIKHK